MGWLVECAKLIWCVDLTVKAVLFDMGNTLVKYDVGSPEEVFRRVLTSLGISRSVDEVKRAMVNAEQEAKDVNLVSLYGKVECEEYWHRWDSIVLKHLNIAENEALAKLVHSRWFDYVDCTLYSEVKEVLLKLKRLGLKVGLITTAYEEEIALVLGKANLEKEIFDVVVGADTIKKVKPHADVFRYAVKMLKVKPEETVFVGDHVDADYKGAKNAGLQALLLSRREENKEQGLKTIASLKEIFANIS